MLPLLLLISFLGTCGTVFYILATHQGERKSSISLHVAANKKSHALFAGGHFVGGLAFLIFCYKFFYVTHGSLLLLVLASLGFLIEQVQAFLPNNARFERVHTVAAVGMATFMGLILVVAPIVVRLNAIWLDAYICVALIWVLAGVYALLNKHKFYQSQVIFFSVFYLFLLILLYSAI
jgi:hypothetical protein